MDRLKALIEKKQAKLDKAKEITAHAEAEERLELDEDEQTRFDALMTEVDSIQASIDREKRLLEADAEVPIPDKPETPKGSITGGVPAIMEDPKRGFRNAGEYFRAVLLGSRKGPSCFIDERLGTMMQATDKKILEAAGLTPWSPEAAVPGSSYAQEAVGADGGFLVPPEFSATIREYSLEQDALLPYTQQDTVAGNGMKFPVSEQTPWGTTGVRAYWEGEAGLTTNTKPVLEEREIRLRKLIGLVPATDEIIADAPIMNSWLPRQLGISIRYKTNLAIHEGGGTGQPTGYRNSGAVVTQAKEGSQTADTINANNVAKMYARNLNPGRAIWLINPDSFNQLVVMSISNQPVWTAPNQGMQMAPNGLLLGRPVVFCEFCATLGDLGDIEFVDLMSYQTITKAGGIDFATSMHLWFDYDMMAFRAVFRIGGASVFRQAVTPPVSAVTRSPYVDLAARA